MFNAEPEVLPMLCSKPASVHKEKDSMVLGDSKRNT
jgi:hypothetical protein